MRFRGRGPGILPRVSRAEWQRARLGKGAGDLLKLLRALGQKVAFGRVSGSGGGKDRRCLRATETCEGHSRDWAAGKRRVPRGR